MFYLHIKYFTLFTEMNLSLSICLITGKFQIHEKTNDSEPCGIRPTQYAFETKYINNVSENVFSDTLSFTSIQLTHFMLLHVTFMIP